MRRALLVALLLAGCAEPLPQPPKVVYFEKPVPCLKTLPAKPALVTDQALLAMDDYDLVVSLAEDRLERRAYEGVLEAAMLPCLTVEGRPQKPSEPPRQPVKP